MLAFNERFVKVRYRFGNQYSSGRILFFIDIIYINVVNML